MPATKKHNGTLSVTAYRGDAKTLLAFNLPKAKSVGLAGFSIQVRPRSQDPYYTLNTLQFETPAQHAQDPTLPANSSINAPFHKFRWIHFPGQAHQGVSPFFGTYTYTVTPRYFDEHKSMQPLDPALSASVKIEVAPFAKKGLEVGFTRGFTQSQAFVRHFGLNAKIRPPGKALLFDTTLEAGVNAAGEHFSYRDEYEWLGFTAREKIFALLDEVVSKKSLRLDVFAYDLNEPDLLQRLLTLARQGRVRVILDNASLHHSASSPKPEDQFEALFRKAAKKSADLMRGKFGRYAHDKVFIVSKGQTPTGQTPQKVMTGSTNFSVTGLYVNSNHVLLFDDAKVAAKYSEVFDLAWATQARAKAFQQSPLSAAAAAFSSGVPAFEVTFSPHREADAKRVLADLAARIAAEGRKSAKTGSVLFAVMQLDGSDSPVYTALRSLHADESVFSYGISDTTSGISLHRPGSKRGVLVTGKPANTVLPPPFSQVPGVGGGHQVHHKFVVCGFNGADPVAYCGSSNLASGGEVANGDNLLAIRDADVATVFAIEALALVDHFDFLDRVAKGPEAKKKKKPGPAPVSKHQAAVDAGWFLSTTDRWAAPYFDPQDLRSVDRILFAG
jgi:hypothetical protein